MELLNQEVDLAEQFIKQLVGAFDPTQFRDDYRTRVMEMIESKQSGITPAKNEPRKRMGQVVNLMDALKKSLEQKKVASEQKKGPERVSTSAKKASSRAKKAS